VIAALYVDADGIYAGRPDVDPWDVKRDARAYPGPYPVVAHPPCERWGAFARSIWGRVGEDEGCFAAALASVERWGGVLEHPSRSDAWKAFNLPPPPLSGGWVRNLYRPGWACHVEQGNYGHEAPKATWLYYVGAEPPPLRWGKADLPIIDSCPSVGRTRGRTVEVMTRRERRATPPEFCELLLKLARGSRS
jgi:hypothetical protein